MDRVEGRVGIAPGALEDLRAIAEIYHHYVRTSAATFEVAPRSDESWRVWFDGFGERGRHRLLVAREHERVLGYASSTSFRPRAAYAPTVETSVYLDAGSTSRGAGSALLGALLSELETEDVHRACAGIALPNPVSVRLHERLGYRHVGTFTEQGRKFGRYWDVAWFERAFPDRVAEEAS
jgi:phosphinothricin acetyltransferase